MTREGRRCVGLEDRPHSGRHAQEHAAGARRRGGVRPSQVDRRWATRDTSETRPRRVRDMSTCRCAARRRTTCCSQSSAPRAPAPLSGPALPRPLPDRSWNLPVGAGVLFQGARTPLSPHAQRAPPAHTPHATCTWALRRATRILPPRARPRVSLSATQTVTRKSPRHRCARLGGRILRRLVPMASS